VYNNIVSSEETSKTESPSWVSEEKIYRSNFTFYNFNIFNGTSFFIKTSHGFGSFRSPGEKVCIHTTSTRIYSLPGTKPKAHFIFMNYVICGHLCRRRARDSLFLSTCSAFFIVTVVDSQRKILRNTSRPR